MRQLGPPLVAAAHKVKQQLVELCRRLHVQPVIGAVKHDAAAVRTEPADLKEALQGEHARGAARAVEAGQTYVPKQSAPVQLSGGGSAQESVRVCVFGG